MDSILPSSQCDNLRCHSIFNDCLGVTANTFGSVSVEKGTIGTVFDEIYPSLTNTTLDTAGNDSISSSVGSDVRLQLSHSEKSGSLTGAGYSMNCVSSLMQ